MPRHRHLRSEPNGLWKVREALGSPPPPRAFAQEPWDFDPTHLVRLSRLTPDEEATFEDLWHYAQDLNYADIDGDFLRHALPFCLAGWHRCMTGRGDEYGGFVEYFYPALLRGIPILRAPEAVAVSEFMRNSILSVVDEQRTLKFEGSESPAYKWFLAFASHGVLFSDMSELWRPLWKADTIGRAVAVVQYASCLIYPEGCNPVFSKWTPTGGGGPPPLWTYEGHLYTQSWLQPNLEFLCAALKPATVRDSLDRAVSILAGTPQHSRASHVRRGCDEHWATLVSRCAELPRFLACDQRGLYLEWRR